MLIEKTCPTVNDVIQVSTLQRLSTFLAEQVINYSYVLTSVCINSGVRVIFRNQPPFYFSCSFRTYLQQNYVWMDAILIEHFKQNLTKNSWAQNHNANPHYNGLIFIPLSSINAFALTGLLSVKEKILLQATPETEVC